MTQYAISSDSQLTAERIREAVRKASKIGLQTPEPKIIVHPLRWLLIGRRCDPMYCRLLGVRLVPGWRYLHDQTYADYYGWGINGSDY